MTMTKRAGRTGSPIENAVSAAPLRPEAQVVLRQFRVVFNAVKAHFQQVEKRSGLGGAQIWALSLVAREPGMGVGQLAAAMDVRQSTASNLVKALVLRGLLQSGRNGVDRRTVQLHVTADGMHALKKAPAPFAGLLPEALERLDDETLVRLERDLKQLIATLALDPEGKDAQTPLASL